MRMKRKNRRFCNSMKQHFLLAHFNKIAVIMAIIFVFNPSKQQVSVLLQRNSQIILLSMATRLIALQCAQFQFDVQFSSNRIVVYSSAPSSMVSFIVEIEFYLEFAQLYQWYALIQRCKTGWKNGINWRKGMLMESIRKQCRLNLNLVKIIHWTSKA